MLYMVTGLPDLSMKRQSGGFCHCGPEPNTKEDMVSMGNEFCILTCDARRLASPCPLQRSHCSASVTAGPCGCASGSRAPGAARSLLLSAIVRYMLDGTCKNSVHLDSCLTKNLEWSPSPGHHALQNLLLSMVTTCWLINVCSFLFQFYCCVILRKHWASKQNSSSNLGYRVCPRDAGQTSWSFSSCLSLNWGVLTLASEGCWENYMR